MKPPFVLSRDEIQAQQTSLRTLARSLALNDEAADDVVQETWLAALDKPPHRFRNLNGWLRTVTRNVASRFRRREGQRQRRESIVARPEATFPPDEAAAASSRRYLEGVVAEMREPYQTVIQLRFFEELSIRAIAQRLNRPEGTVQSQVKRGLEKMREKLDREYGDRSNWSALLFTATGGSGGTGGAAGPHSGNSPHLLLRIEVLALVTTSLAAGFFFVLPLLDEAPPGIAPSFVKAADKTGSRTAILPDDERPRSTATVQRESFGVSEPTAPPVGPGSVSARAIWPNGGPANDLLLWIEPAEPAQAPARSGRTDSSGRIDFEELDPGTWTLKAATGASSSLVVSPTRTTEVELRIPPGRTLIGQVLSRDTWTAVDSSIWLSAPGRPDDGRTVLRTDEEGRFELRDVDPRCWLGATAEGWAPSRILSLASPSIAQDDVTEVTLIMPQPAADVLGFVKDAEGSPIAGADVTCDVRQSWQLAAGFGTGPEAIFLRRRNIPPVPIRQRTLQRPQHVQTHCARLDKFEPAVCRHRTNLP